MSQTRGIFEWEIDLHLAQKLLGVTQKGGSQKLWIDEDGKENGTPLLADTFIRFFIRNQLALAINSTRFEKLLTLLKQLDSYQTKLNNSEKDRIKISDKDFAYLEKRCEEKQNEDYQYEHHSLYRERLAKEIENFNTKKAQGQVYEKYQEEDYARKTAQLAQLTIEVEALEKQTPKIKLRNLKLYVEEQNQSFHNLSLFCHQKMGLLKHEFSVLLREDQALKESLTALIQKRTKQIDQYTLINTEADQINKKEPSLEEEKEGQHSQIPIFKPCALSLIR